MFNFFKKAETPRILHRKFNNFKRSFLAAQMTEQTNSWSTHDEPINQTIKNNLTTLRARSRDLARNDGYIRRFLQLLENNVIGRAGLKLQAKVTDRNSNKLDDRANEAIEKAWSNFCSWGVANVKGRDTMIDLQKLFVRQLLRDGEILVMFINNSKVNNFSFALQVLDPAVLNTNHDDTWTNGNKIRMGVEYGAFGRAVAYHLLTDDTTHQTAYLSGGKNYLRVEADKILHCYLSEYADQSRGLPAATSAMLNLRNLNGYTEAEIIGKRVSAAKGGFFTRNDEGAGYEGDSEEDALIMDAQAGVFEELPNGVDFKTFDFSGNSASYDIFIKAILRGISAGLGVSYHSLANDLESVNYSSARIGLLEDREAYTALQDWLIESMMLPIYKEWLHYSLEAGRITLPGGNSLRVDDEKRYQNVRFQGRRWLWVDPAKDMAANEKALANNITSISRIIREQGSDPDEVFNEIAAEQEKLKQLGITTEALKGAFFTSENGAEDEQ